MTSDLSTLLRLPSESRLAPSQFAAEPQALSRWLEQLPRTNLGQSTRSLFQAVGELNAVKLAPDLRLTLLERLRPAIYFVANGLRKHFLNQPLVLGPQAQQVTELSHQLFFRLVQGYGKVALDAQTVRKGSDAAIAWSLHHAMADLGQNLLRDLQLYREPQPGIWRLLHTLARQATELKVQDRPVADAQNGNATISSAYKRLLLLGSARTYQLRQDELIRLYANLNDWAADARLVSPDQGLLLIDGHSDRGPVYRQYLTQPPDADWLGLDTAPVAQRLLSLIEPDGDSAAGALSSDTLALLAHTWRQAGQRSFERRGASGAVEVTLGLSATHYAISGDVDFQLLLNQRGYQRLASAASNPFLKRPTPPGARPGTPRTRDIWDTPFSTTTRADERAAAIEFEVRTHYERNQTANEKFPRHTMAVVNVSAAGYCLCCAGDSAQLKTGEIVGIRENSHKSWQVGVVRWVRVAQSGPQLGIELLSPNATAYGGRVLNKSGPPGEYLRVLVLPALDAMGQPPTVITPRLPFRAGQKINLALHDEETRAQLVRRVRFTPAFSQFEYRALSGAGGTEQPDTSKKIDGFDNLWDTL